MNNPNIDELIDKIQSPKTKDYFGEVVRSFYCNNYRSAVVMLYSVVVCDLIYKLTELSELYNDKKAEGIIGSIKSKQEQNPKSSEWEKELVEQVLKSTKLLEMSDYVNITALQQHRNLSAHPVLKEGLDLYCPNKTTVQAHIINMLEGVLIKPPIMMQKIFDAFIEDVATIKNILIVDGQLEEYIKSKYLDKINIEIEYKFFRSLWKLVFKLSDEDCMENKEINFKVLNIIFKRHNSYFTKRLSEEKDYYSSNIDIKKDEYITYVIYFFNEHTKIFSKLTDEVKLSMRGYIEHDDDLKNKAIFLSENIKTHFKSINGGKSSTLLYLFNIAKETVNYSFALDFNIRMFSASVNFDTADTRFTKLIEPFVNDFSEKQLTAIIKGIDDNNQIYGRKRAIYSNRIIVAKIKEYKGSDCDISKYANVEI